MGKRIQKILLREIGKEVLNLGYTGENEHTEITINCAEVYAGYPDATVQMVVKPPAGDQYLAVVTYTAGLLKWNISASDVAASGSGNYQLIFEDGGVEIFRSAIGKTQIMASLDESTGDAPTPQETWAEAMSGKIAELAGAAVDTKLDNTILYLTASEGTTTGTNVAAGACITRTFNNAARGPSGRTLIGVPKGWVTSGDDAEPVPGVVLIGWVSKNNNVYATFMNTTGSAVTVREFCCEVWFVRSAVI